MENDASRMNVLKQLINNNGAADFDSIFEATVAIAGEDEMKALLLEMIGHGLIATSVYACTRAGRSYYEGY